MHSSRLGSCLPTRVLPSSQATRLLEEHARELLFDFLSSSDTAALLQALNESPSDGSALLQLSSRSTWLPMFVEATSSLPYAVSVVDVQVAGLPLIYVNEAWEALTGYSSADVLGRNCRLLQGVATEEIAVAQMVEAIREGRTVHVCISNYRQDGTRFRNSLSLHPLFDDCGDFRYVVGRRGERRCFLYTSLHILPSHSPSQISVASDANAGKQEAQGLLLVRSLIPTTCPSHKVR